MGAFLVLLLAARPAVFADEASKAAKIEEMFRIAKIDRLQDQVMEQMKAALGNMFDNPHGSRSGSDP